MKSLKILIALLFISVFASAQTPQPWINEIHYDNVGGDINEGVEVAIPVCYSYTTLQLVLYNGNGGTTYFNQNVDILTGTTANNVTFVWIANSLQNGPSEGIALVADGTVIQFLSYEGVVTASNGPAMGLTSTDIGITEGTGTATQSLQLQGSGNQYSDFTWAANIASTNNAINNGQTILSNIDFASLQNPASGNLEAGEEYRIQSQIYVAGLTDATAGQAPNIEAWIGYSTIDATTTTDFNSVNWTWVPASFLTEVGNNDEYEVDLGPEITTAGTYYYVSRFRLSCGAFIYGGFSGGFWNGSSNVSGVLTVSSPVPDFVNLQFPNSGNIPFGGNHSVFAQIFEAAPTQSSGDQGTAIAGALAGIEAWIGYSTTDATTTADFASANWTWVPATFNTDSVNNDEYTVDLGGAIPGPGTYYYISRFRYNNGVFSYGGIVPAGSGGNFWDGSSFISGVLTVNSPATDCSDLYISEYIEGSSNNKYLELYNPTNSNINLTGYSIENYNNGSNTVTSTIALSGAIASQGVFIIANTGASLAGITPDQTSGNISFNGNDAILLKNGATTIDSFGQIGVNPGISWPGACGSQNITLVRNPDVLIGDYSATNAFTTDTEWTCYAEDTRSYLGSHISDCQCTAAPAIWDGTAWSPNAPDSNTPAIIMGDYNTSITTPGFVACSLTVNTMATLIVDENYTIEIENNVTNNGTISVLTTGSFVQNNNSATFTNGSGNSTVTKKSAFANDWLEYTYWSSPVIGETIGNALLPADSNRRFRFRAENFMDNAAETNNNNMLVNGFHDDEDDNGNDWMLVSGGDTMLPGVGYAATLSTISFNPPMAGVAIQVDHIFTGPFNNGIIDVTAYRNDFINLDNNWNLIGNPYPSAISIDDFFAENVYDENANGVLEGAIYFWSHQNPPSGNVNGNSQNNFSQTDYILVNGMGGTAAGDITGDNIVDADDNPKPFIPSGQGFFISFDDNATNVTAPSNNADGEAFVEGTVTFNNAMRVTGDNNQFYRTASNATSTINRLWLNLTTDTGVFNQILIGYTDAATNGDDGTYYDAIRNRSFGNNTFFYSTIENSNENYAIQGRATQSLTVDEVVPLGLYTTIANPAIYSISISHFEGDFLANNTVYLKDNYANVIHDLNTSDYSFTTDSGEYKDRFEVVFKTNFLSVDGFDLSENDINIIELQNDNVKFTVPSNTTIKTVKIIDVLGREIYNFRGSESTETYNLSHLSSATYIAQITLNNGEVITKKAIKK